MPTLAPTMPASIASRRHEFGLSGYSTAATSAALRVAEEMEAGIVGANVGIISTEGGAFGGVKQSVSAARARSTGSRNFSK